MNSELPTFNTPQKQSEKPSIPNTFLREQIRLPEEEWDMEFRILVDKMIKESIKWNDLRLKIRNREEAKDEESPEAKHEQTFRRYLKELGLNEDELRGKRIMDLGFGDGGLVKHLIAKGIAPESYGVDTHPIERTGEGFDGHLFQQSSEEDFPVQNLDYILAIRSVWHDESDKDGYVMNVENILEKSLFALKEGGEMRIYPIEENAKRNSDKGFAEDQQKRWDAVLLAMSKKYRLKYYVEPRNIFVNPSNRDVTLQSVLIIRKQAEAQ